MSAPKAIAQMLLHGAKMFRVAFRDAIKQANENSAAARAAAGNAKTEDLAKDQATRTTGITLDESMKILNVENLENMEELRKKYEYLFKMNDYKDGGSLYVQAKIARAFERIQIELAENANKQENANKKESDSTKESESQ